MEAVIADLLSKRDANAKLENVDIYRAVDLRRAEVRSVADDFDPSVAKVDDKKAKVAEHRMLDVTIKLAKVLTASPTLRAKLQFLEQRLGIECLCDSPSKLESLLQLCGGFQSPSTTAETALPVIDAILILFKRGLLKNPASLTRHVLVGGKGSLGLVQRLLKRAQINRFLSEKFVCLLYTSDAADE